MSWLFSQALVEEYLVDISSDGEQSVQSNGNPIPQAYCAPDKMKDFSRLSRYGMTFAVLTGNHGEELSMSSVVDFHVRTLVQQGKAQVLTEKEVECGEKWRGSFVKYDPDSSLWRTHQCSLLGDLEPFSETWPQWGLMRNGECWEQTTLAQTIRGTESGSEQNKWATPTTMDKMPPKSAQALHKEATQARPGRSKPANLRDQVSNMQNWPTPTATDYMGAKQNGIESQNGRYVRTSLTTGVKFGAKLTDAVNLEVKKKFPTPKLSDHKDRGNMSNPSIQRRAAKGKQMDLSMVAHPTSGQLNPTWVEWLMGWPLGWTDLKPLEMDKSLFVPQPLGES
jgi:DNA (cytosine-5)-methyltransferase 1